MRIHGLCLIILLVLAASVLRAQTSGLPDDTGTGALPTATAPAPPAGEQPADPPPADDGVTPPPNVAATLPATAKRSSLLAQRGQKEIEMRLAYSHFSKNTLFIDGVAMLPVMVIGQVAVQEIRRDVLIASLSARYGLLDNVEVELKVPYRYQTETRDVPDASPAKQLSLTGSGIGDVEGGVYLHIPGKRGSAQWIANVQVKSATGTDIFSIDPDTDVALGTGFWSTRVGITGVSIADPAAVFWSMGYTYNWLRKNIRVVSQDSTTGDTTVSYYDIKPGNGIDVGAGFAYAINPRLSINTGVSLSFNGSTSSNHNKIANTAVTAATLRVGAVWLTERRWPVDLALNIGLTDDSPDFTLEWRKSIKF